MSPLIMVGEAPSPTSDPQQPILSGRSGRWLRWLLGSDCWGRLLLMCDFVNLVPLYPGTSYPDREARIAADRIVKDAREDGREKNLILCGKKVAKAFNIQGQDSLATLDGVFVGLGRVTLLPHPSGLCRWWNNEANRQAARRLLTSEVERLFGSLEHVEDGSDYLSAAGKAVKTHRMRKEALTKATDEVVKRSRERSGDR